jgi:putative flippase GtrA
MPGPGLAEPCRYLALGCLIYGGSLLMMAYLTGQLRLGELRAYAIVQGVIFCVGFMLGRAWVFRARRGHWFAQVSRFLASTACFRLLNLSVYSASWAMLGLPRELGIFLAITLIFPIKYHVDRTLVFRPDVEA